MAKISEQDYRDATECVMWTLSLFQKGFETICKENPKLCYADKIALTGKWWEGQMMLFSHVGENRGLM